jgi:hypothetical protein
MQSDGGKRADTRCSIITIQSGQSALRNWRWDCEALFGRRAIERPCQGHVGTSQASSGRRKVTRQQVAWERQCLEAIKPTRRSQTLSFAWAQGGDSEAQRVHLRRGMTSPRGPSPSPVGGVRARGSRCASPTVDGSDQARRVLAPFHGPLPPAQQPPTGHSPPFGSRPRRRLDSESTDRVLTLFSAHIASRAPGRVGPASRGVGRRENSKGRVALDRARQENEVLPPIGSPGAHPWRSGARLWLKATS